jgi:hypothetical protein
MTTEDYNFEEMGNLAMNVVDDSPQEDSKIDEVSSIYKLDDELLKEGWDYDSTGIYIHFNKTYQAIGVNENREYFLEEKARDDLYLWVNRNLETKKKIEINFKWAIKTSGGYDKKRGFAFNETLDIGDEKILKDLNKKVFFSGGKNSNPSSENSYVTFVDDFTSKIIDSDGLEVFKELDYELPEYPEDDESFEDTSDVINSFNEYPEDIQQEAMKILNDGVLFEEIQNSVSLTHQGHDTSRNALILQEVSLFVGDGVHVLIGGDSGDGKSDLAIVVGLNFPKKYVHDLRNLSPKHLYYACDEYNDDYNVLVFDDMSLDNEDIINMLKEFSDNTKDKKELKTVEKQNAKTYSFGDAKFLVILTYAKTLPDDELANRLVNLSAIVEKDDDKLLVKHKIRDNNVTGGNKNQIIEKIRLILQCAIHNLIEQNMIVFNPFLAIFNPDEYNNRDESHFMNMVKSKTFFSYYQREHLTINDDLTLTIGSFEDYDFVGKIWSKDAQTQKYKLSARQKEILKLLPEYTNEDAYAHVEKFNESISGSGKSKAWVKSAKENEPLANSLAKKLKCGVSTLKHDLDRFGKGTHKSLYELGIVEKIPLDEGKEKSPNFYYIVKDEGNLLKSSKSYDNNMQNVFAHMISSSITKQKIIIDLLLYANIIINKKGYIYLKNYCDNYDEDIDVKSYDSYVGFIKGFFDNLDYGECVISQDQSNYKDLSNMMEYKNEIYDEFHKKFSEDMSSDNGDDFAHTTKNKEKAPIDDSSNDSMCNSELPIDVNTQSKIKGILDEINVEYGIAHEIYGALSSGDKNLEEIRSSICECVNPDDFNVENLPLKVEVSLKRLVEHNFLVTIEPINQAKRYEMTSEFSKLFEGDDD